MIEPGVHYVRFMDGRTLRIKVRTLVHNHLGHPLFLVAEDDTMYNFNNIVSLRRKKD